MLVFSGVLLRELQDTLFFAYPRHPQPKSSPNDFLEFRIRKCCFFFRVWGMLCGYVGTFLDYCKFDEDLTVSYCKLGVFGGVTNHLNSRDISLVLE